MIVREYSRCPRCPQWRGIVPIIGFLSFITCAGMIGYEIGRYHRSVADFIEAAELRVEYFYGTHP